MPPGLQMAAVDFSPNELVRAVHEIRYLGDGPRFFEDWIIKSRFYPRHAGYTTVSYNDVK
jgi:hypothetical protein